MQACAAVFAAVFAGLSTGTHIPPQQQPSQLCVRRACRASSAHLRCFTWTEPSEVAVLTWPTRACISSTLIRPPTTCDQDHVPQRLDTHTHTHTHTLGCALKADSCVISCSALLLSWKSQQGPYPRVLHQAQASWCARKLGTCEAINSKGMQCEHASCIQHFLCSNLYRSCCAWPDNTCPKIHCCSTCRSGCRGLDSHGYRVSRERNLLHRSTHAHTFGDASA